MSFFPLLQIGSKAKVKTLCQSLSKPSEATTKSLSKLFPGTVNKRKFDPLNECINSESKRKKKAAVLQCKGRPKQVKVVYLQSNPVIIPKGTTRETIKKEGRIKDVPFHRFISNDEVKQLINEVFPTFSSEFVFLQGHKDNTLSLASKQDLDGKGVIELAKHGCLYLLEQPSAQASNVESSVPKSTAPGSQSESTEQASSRILVSASDIPTSREVSVSSSEPPYVSPAVNSDQYTDFLSEDTKDILQRADEVIEKLKVSSHNAKLF